MAHVEKKKKNLESFGDFGRVGALPLISWHPRQAKPNNASFFGSSPHSLCLPWARALQVQMVKVC
jgi:hypothetical protein